MKIRFVGFVSALLASVMVCGTALALDPSYGFSNPEQITADGVRAAAETAAAAANQVAQTQMMTVVIAAAVLGVAIVAAALIVKRKRA